VATTLVVPGLFTILADLVDPPVKDFTCDIAAYDLQQSPNNIDVPASFCADGYSDIASVTQSLVLSVLCDWESADSLAWFLSDNHLKKGYVTVSPTGGAVGAGPAWTAEVRFVRPNVTLSTGAAAQVDVTLPVFAMTPIKPAVVVGTEAQPEMAEA